MEKTELKNIQKDSENDSESRTKGDSSKKRYRAQVSESLHYFFWYDEFSGRYYRVVFDGNGEICQGYTRYAKEDPPKVDELCPPSDAGIFLVSTDVLEMTEDVPEEQLREFVKDGLIVTGD